MHNLVTILGADGGLGSLIAHEIENKGHRTIRVGGPGKLHGFDFADSEQVIECADFIAQRTGQIDSNKDMYRILINCIGINYIDWFQDLDFGKFNELMKVNVEGSIRIVQMLMGHNTNQELEADYNWFNSHKVGGKYQKHGAFCNIISNASHVAMTNSVFYNASKAAQHMATMSMARELRKSHGLCVFGISPNKLAGTGMSEYIEKRVPELRGWTPEEAHKYQLSALPAEEETDPHQLAEFVGFLLSRPERHKFLTNTVIPYGA